MTELSIYPLNDPLEILSPSELDVIKQILALSKKYREGGLEQDLLQIQNDVLELSSLLVTLTTISSVINSYADNIESQLSIHRAKIRAQIKKDKETSKTRLTVEDIKDQALLKTEEIYKELQKYKDCSDYCKGIYFSAKELTSLLNKALYRLTPKEYDIN